MKVRLTTFGKAVLVCSVVGAGVWAGVAAAVVWALNGEWYPEF